MSGETEWDVGVMQKISQSRLIFWLYIVRVAIEICVGSRANDKSKPKGFKDMCNHKFKHSSEELL
jgi:hypothetical protein